MKSFIDFLSSERRVMRDQPTPEQTPERIAEIRNLLAERDAAAAAYSQAWEPWARTKYTSAKPDGWDAISASFDAATEPFENDGALAMVRDLLAAFDALTATLAHLTQENGELRESLNDAEQQVRVLQPGGTYAWKCRAEQAEATLARVKARLQAVTDHMDRAGGDRDGMPECPWCKAGPEGDDHAADCELVAARAALVDPPVSSSTETT